MRSEHADRIGKDFWERPDLVIEIVSENNRRHDLVTKRDEYARAGIPEYWIVDPEEETITVLVLKPRRKTYVEHGTFAKGMRHVRDLARLLRRRDGNLLAETLTMATGTKRTKPKPVRGPSEPEPTWEIARLFPPQGEWSEEEYFALNTNRLIEFSDGRLEFLPMPTIFHQLIMKFIFYAIGFPRYGREVGAGRARRIQGAGS